MVQTQPAHSHMVQARTDRCDFFCMENIFSVTPASASGYLLLLQVSVICSGELQTNMVKNRDECSASRTGQPSIGMQQKHAQSEVGCPRLPPPAGRRG